MAGFHGGAIERKLGPSVTFFVLAADDAAQVRKAIQKAKLNAPRTPAERLRQGQIFEEYGIWYDALRVAVELTRENPNDLEAKAFYDGLIKRLRDEAGKRPRPRRRRWLYRLAGIEVLWRPTMMLVLALRSKTTLKQQEHFIANYSLRPEPRDSTEIRRWSMRNACENCWPKIPRMEFSKPNLMIGRKNGSWVLVSPIRGKASSRLSRAGCFGS